MDPGGGGAGESPGGPKGAELVLEKSAQEADAELLQWSSKLSDACFTESLAEKRQLSQWSTDIA